MAPFASTVLGGHKCADDLPYYIYHCHMFIYGSFSCSWARHQPCFFTQLLPLCVSIRPLSASWPFSSFQTTFLVFLSTCLSLCPCLLPHPFTDPLHPPTSLTPCYFTPTVPARGRVALKWLILPQTELNMEGGWAPVDFVKLLINERSSGRCLLKCTSFWLSLGREVRLGHVSL